MKEEKRDRVLMDGKTKGDLALKKKKGQREIWVYYTPTPFYIKYVYLNIITIQINFQF